MQRLDGYFYIAMTILLTVYGQLIVKWQVSLAGTVPDASAEKAMFFVRLVLNPWILSGFAAAFLASVFWMGALTKFRLSYAYPFVALTFVFVVAAGGLLFGEPISVVKIAGIFLIIAGVTVASLG